MAESKITDEQLKKELSQGYTLSSISKKYSMDYRTLQRRKRSLIDKGFSPEHSWNNTVPDGYHIKGMSDYVDNDGNILRRWVKSEKNKEDQIKEFLEELKNCLKELPKYPLFETKTKINYSDTLAVYPLGDPHIGMLAWAEECGDNWDLKIAEDTFRKMFDIIVGKSPRSKKAMLEILGDTLHYDNIAGITTRSGNILDTDGRYTEMIRVCVKIILNMINSLLQYHEEVIVDIVRGNHDDVGSIWLNELLLRLYEDNPRVTIINQQGPIHILEFGKVLIASHHGHTIKMDSLPITIASDYAEAWGRTKHRYCLTGHIHKDTRVQATGNEYSGMWVESFRTLAAKDSYATWGAWRSKRDTKCIVYHKELGEIERYTASIDSLMLQAKDDI